MFQPGDIVRRIKGHNYAKEGMYLGAEYTVWEHRDPSNLALEGICSLWVGDNFELVGKPGIRKVIYL